ncbi:hypothetical protein jhhlp_001406 [Lomentospora prolificans]|uniref:Heterokaryon incompatibility domain-containing protein n=1 Tax=Lomentospora prolificans TaxID=41688 RepID=A0A2N3NI59_9PEZI|nr:hypothetical protein jhhlp_001406 [Lomentospora prolificans]
MRIINTETRELEEYPDLPPKPYAILSHTWGADEVTIQQFSRIQPTLSSQETQGWVKIWSFCKKARDDGFAYAWIDTCCIDKTSSAELTEAINSMYRWYEEASVCYAYLIDIPTTEEAGSFFRDTTQDGPVQWRWRPTTKFRESRWFTRGWTLQELIAPKVVEFYAADWSEIGSKSSIRNELSEITGIDKLVLGGSPPSRCNAAQIMSWAATRQTTRLEDAAYSLLGLFGVNMPLIYGEGTRAFLRLQDEILRAKEDLSLLLRGPHLKVYDPDEIESMGRTRAVGPLAETPAAFRVDSSPVFNFADIWRINPTLRPSNKSPLATNADFQFNVPLLTARGLRLPVRLLKAASGHVLACLNWKTTGNRFICLVLRGIRREPGIYFRQMGANGNICLATAQQLAQASPTTIYVANIPGRESERIPDKLSFTLNPSDLCTHFAVKHFESFELLSTSRASKTGVVKTTVDVWIGLAEDTDYAFCVNVDNTQCWRFHSRNPIEGLEIQTPMVESAKRLVTSAKSFVTERGLDRLNLLYAGHAITISLRRGGASPEARTIKISSKSSECSRPKWGVDKSDVIKGCGLVAGNEQDAHHTVASPEDEFYDSDISDGSSPRPEQEASRTIEIDDGSSFWLPEEPSRATMDDPEVEDDVQLGDPIWRPRTFGQTNIHEQPSYSCQLGHSWEVQLPDTSPSYEAQLGDPFWRAPTFAQANVRQQPGGVRGQQQSLGEENPVDNDGECMDIY